MSDNGTQGTLVGDIGGTRARFGVVDGRGDLVGVRILAASEYASLIEAASDYLAGFDREVRPRRGAIAVGGPVYDDNVRMTNRLWSFSVSEACRALGLAELEVMNDFIALALATPDLSEEQSRVIRAGQRIRDAPIAVVGAGTGLGVSALVPMDDQWLTLATEGGHRDLAAATDREWEIVKRLQHRFGRVSAERVLSGPGLVNLYEAICELEGREPEAREPEGVVARALAGSCGVCQEAIEVFARQLGAVAADLVLTYGARGGLWLGGGVLQGMSTAFDADRFEDGFLDKGRFRSYVEPVPVRLILDPTAALRGASQALDAQLRVGIRATGPGVVS